MAAVNAFSSTDDGAFDRVIKPIVHFNLQSSTLLNRVIKSHNIKGSFEKLVLYSYDSQSAIIYHNQGTVERVADLVSRAVNVK